MGATKKLDARECNETNSTKSAGRIDIVGMLAKDGSTYPFECRHLLRARQHHFFYGFPSDKLGNAATSNGDIVLVEANGKQWLGADVQYASAPHRD